MTTVKLFIGYSTRPAGDTTPGLIPTFVPPANYKNDDTIKAYVAEKEAAFAVESKDFPYTGTFDAVYVVDPKSEKLLHWTYREPGAGRPPVSVAVRNYLVRTYGDVLGKPFCDNKSPSLIFVGFNPRLFLKMLGLECSLPKYGKPLPPRAWYGNVDHRDIAEAILPREFKALPLLGVLAQRRPVESMAAKRWDEQLQGWPGPGVHPDRDVWFAVELAAQLGFMDE